MERPCLPGLGSTAGAVGTLACRGVREMRRARPGPGWPGDSNDPKEARSMASMRLREVAGCHPRESIAVLIKERAALPWTAIFTNSPNAMR